MDEVKDQRALWAGQFGDEYTQRNQNRVGPNLAFFAKVLDRCRDINSVLELGAGVGDNLRAIQQLLPKADLWGVEINQTAFAQLVTVAPDSFNCPLESLPEGAPHVTLTLSKGLLIHIAPEWRQNAYAALYQHSNRYILLAEYYAPHSTMIPYRSQTNALWKHDFAGDMLDRYQDLYLLDYGFQYHRDGNWPQDDLNWFLMEKRT